MIQRATILSLLFLIFFIGIALFKILTPSTESRLHCIRDPSSSMSDKKKRPNRQVRKDTSKDLWLSRGKKERLHHYVEAPLSILTVADLGNQMQLVEELLEMRGYFQEEIEEKGGQLVQNIRYIYSKKGTYHYGTRVFQSPDVFLALYRIPGNTFSIPISTQQSYLQGTAKDVTLSLLRGSPHFQAKKLKAHVLSQALL